MTRSTRKPKDQPDPATATTTEGSTKSYRQPTDIGEVRRKLLADVDLIHEDDVATMLDVTLQTLWGWRTGKVGVVSPPWVKLGKEVYYRRADIVAWIAGNVVPPSGASAPTAKPSPSSEQVAA